MLAGMKPNDVSNPIRIQFENIDAIIVFQLVAEPKFPAYEEVRAQMNDAAMGEALERQKRVWLDELKRGVYIDVRL
jgi:peptidyl-prolyl cis-trans isomerase SurA